MCVCVLEWVHEDMNVLVHVFHVFTPLYADGHVLVSAGMCICVYQHVALCVWQEKLLFRPRCPGTPVPKVSLAFPPLHLFSPGSLVKMLTLPYSQPRKPCLPLTLNQILNDPQMHNHHKLSAQNGKIRWKIVVLRSQV